MINCHNSYYVKILLLLLSCINSIYMRFKFYLEIAPNEFVKVSRRSFERSIIYSVKHRDVTFTHDTDIAYLTLHLFNQNDN